MPNRRWKVVVVGPAVRNVERLPGKYAAAIIELIDALPGNPTRIGKPFRFELEGKWVARRGPYRVIYRLDETRSTIEILAVAHRAHAYRRP